MSSDELLFRQARELRWRAARGKESVICSYSGSEDDTAAAACALVGNGTVIASLDSLCLRSLGRLRTFWQGGTRWVEFWAVCPYGANSGNWEVGDPSSD